MIHLHKQRRGLSETATKYRCQAQTGSWAIFVRIDLFSICLNFLLPFVEPWMIFEHPCKLHDWIFFWANIEFDNLSTSIHACLNRVLEFTKRFFARRAFGIERKGL